MLPNQGVGAEMMAERWGLSPHAARRVLRAPRTRRRPPRRTPAGSTAQIAPVDRCTDGERGQRDEGIRRGGTVDALAGLKTAFKPEDGVITAGNASQISDGSAALLMTTSEKAARARA